MKIVRSRQYIHALKNILDFIKKDKISAAKNFRSDLDDKINNLPANPYMYRQSHYAHDTHVRDMIFQKYTIVYEVVDTEGEIRILDIFKWVDKKELE